MTALRPGGIVLDLNRAGSLHVLKPTEATVAAWWELASTEDPHLIVKRMEQAARLAPSKRPQTTDRSLTYRVIAQALATAVNDRHTWDARSLFHDTSGDWDDDAERQAWVSPFPTALAMTRRGAMPGIGWHGEPWSQLWALTKDSKPVAILDALGAVHRRGGERVGLMAIYKSESGSITATTSRALRGLLP